MNNPEVTQQALEILRSGEPFQWYVIPLLALVVYVYANEISKKNYRCVAAGLALYMVHWAYEIANALIQHFSGHALWTVPTGTAFLLLVGVGVEISLMFSIAGLVATKTLPEDPKAKILGINNRLFFAIVFAAIFLSSKYSWSGRLPLPGFIPGGVPSRYLSPCTSPSLRQPRTAIIGSRKPRLRLSGLCLPSTPWP